MTSATLRLRGCSNSSSRGVAKNIPTSSAPSMLGTSQVGPIVRRSGSVTCSVIATRMASWEGQNGSLSAGGG